MQLPRVQSSKRRLLWIAHVWPEPDSSAAGYRTYSLLEFLTEHFDVSVCSPCQMNTYQTALNELGIHTFNCAINDSQFDRFITNLAPEVVLFDRFLTEEQFGWRVARCTPQAVRILDTVDLHCLRIFRQEAIRRRCPRRKDLHDQSASLVMSEILKGETYFDREIVQPLTQESPALRLEELSNSSLALREIASIFRSDRTWLVSHFEQQLLLDLFKLPKDLLAVVPLSYEHRGSEVEYPAREHCVAIGNYLHPPNVDSFKVLFEMWPRIRSKLIARGVTLPELHIYGAYASQSDRAFSTDQSIGWIVRGKASDVHQTLARYRVNLAPIRFGAGIKGKIADGWVVDTPCVTTSVGAEGMALDGCFGGVISNYIESFEDAVVKLYTTPDLWRGSVKNGHFVLKQLFSHSQNRAKALELIDDTLDRRDLLRQQNFIGAMLTHHRNRSSEYFARWIETKNLYKFQA